MGPVSSPVPRETSPTAVLQSDHEDSLVPGPTHPLAHRRRRGRGKLEGFMKMPPDVSLEIVSYLLPLDLLHLARSSKGHRLVLMSKSSRIMWRDARKNVPAYRDDYTLVDIPFPDCPPDLSEPEYASLVFETWCLDCGTRSAHPKYTNLALRWRECIACANRNRRLEKPYNSYDKFDQFVIFCRVASPGPPEMPQIFNLLLRFGLDEIYVAPSRQVYDKCMARKERLNPEEYQQYLESRYQMMDDVLQRSEELVIWRDAHQKHQSEARAEAQVHIEQIQAERYAEITARLLQLGWSEQDFPVAGSENYRSWKKIVHRKDPLTEKIWVLVRPHLVRMLSAQRALSAPSALVPCPK